MRFIAGCTAWPNEISVRVLGVRPRAPAGGDYDNSGNRRLGEVRTHNCADLISLRRSVAEMKRESLKLQRQVHVADDYAFEDLEGHRGEVNDPMYAGVD